MGMFHDTMGGLDDHPDLNVPDGFAESILGAYDADITEAGSSAAAMVADLQRQLEEAQAETAKVKIHNYELITAMGVSSTDVAEADADENLPGAAATDGEVDDGGIAGLFETVDEEETN